MSRELQLRISRGLIRAEVIRRGKPIWAGEAPFESPAELSEAIAALAGEASLPSKVKRLRVKLESPLVQLRSLPDLPPVRGAALRLLVANQAGRFFRKNGKPLVTDAAWVRRSHRGRSPGLAIAAAAEEPWLDAIAAGAGAAGLRLETIGPAAPAGSGLILLSVLERASRGRRSRLALRRLGLLAASLWLLAGALVIERIYREQKRIERELAELREPAAALLGLRRELGEATLMVETIEAAERERGGVLSRVAAIAVALPDSAYLTSLTLHRDGSGTVTGAALQAARVAAALDREGAAVSPSLAGPAVREVLGGRERERFTINFGPGRGK